MSSNANTLGEINPIDFYDESPLEPNLIYQGDVVLGLPIVSMPQPRHWLLLRTKSGRRLDEALDQGAIGGLAKVLDSNQSKAEWDSQGMGDFVMAQLSKRPVLVLSQTCDVATKKFIEVAPIFPVTDEAYIGKLVRDEIISAFWVMHHDPELPTECYADLELIQAVHKSYFSRSSSLSHFRLTAYRTRLLQRSITRYFGRPNSFDAGADKVPRTGTYLCVNCFYFYGRVTSTSKAEGMDFEPCGACQGRGWILKGK